MNKRYVMAVAILAGLILPWIVVKLSPVLAQTSPEVGPFVISAVIRRGDPRVGGGTFLDCDACDMNIAGEHGLNDAGQVVISGFAGNCGFGVYVVSGQHKRLRTLSSLAAIPISTLTVRCPKRLASDAV